MRFGEGKTGRHAIPGAARRGAETHCLLTSAGTRLADIRRHRAEPQAAHRGLRVREPLRIRKGYSRRAIGDRAGGEPTETD